MRGKGRKKKTAVTEDYKSVLVKKALGYDTQEIVEEYVGEEDGGVRLLKKKVTTKNVPPDITALKMLIDEQGKSVLEMSDEELATEKKRLLELLRQSEEE